MSSIQNDQIILDDIPIQILRKKHVKRLSIKVDSHHGVIVNVPIHLTEKMIVVFLESAKMWLNKHYKPIQPYCYTQGEKHAFLGVDYPLNLVAGDVQSNVFLDNYQFNVYTQTQDSHTVKQLLYAFYHKEALSLFPTRVDACMQLTPWVKRMPQLKYRFMTSRYGSCSSQGNISLNIHLIKARMELIDYVIFHELCHIKEYHHGPQFYQLMNEVVPNWKQCKEELGCIRF